MVTMSKSAPPASQPLDLLDHEQSQAAAALHATFRELWGQVPSASQIKVWAEANPLLTAGVAAGAGALAGAIVTTSSRPSTTNTSAAASAMEPRQTLFGALLGQVMPMMSVVISEAGRSLLMPGGTNGATGTTRESSAEQFVAGEGI